MSNSSKLAKGLTARSRNISQLKCSQGEEGNTSASAMQLYQKYQYGIVGETVTQHRLFDPPLPLTLTLANLPELKTKRAIPKSTVDPMFQKIQNTSSFFQNRNTSGRHMNNTHYPGYSKGFLCSVQRRHS